MARATGLKRDLRLNKYQTYGNYYHLKPNSFVTYNGDSFDRYLLRMAEMIESANIVAKCISKTPFAFPNTKTKFYKHRNS
jgi:NADH-quinone oxidoreductase subunit D